MVVGTAKVSFADANHNALSDLQNKVTQVQEQATQAVVSANGKNSTYSGRNEPAHPQEGDTWFWDDGADSGIRVFTNGKWVDSVDTKTLERINNAVDGAIETSKTYTDELNENQVQTTNALNEKVDKSVKELTDSQQSISSQATAYTDSAVADANAKAVQIGQTTAQNAQKALDEAKKDFTSSFASQASQTASMASDVTSKASQYASQAKSEAIAVATSADGVVRTEFKKTTDSMTATIQQNKSDADGKITKAQTTATQALDGLSTKVEKTEYNKTTGDLTSKINTTSDTAEKSKQDIADIKVANDKQDNRMLQIEKNATGVKQTVSDLSTEQGKQRGSISKLEQRADGFDATVTKVNNLAVGGRNLLTNTNKDISITSHTTDGWPGWVNIDTGFSFEHGKTYTFSAEANNSTDKIAEASIRVWEPSTNTQVGIYAFPADGKRHSVTFTTPNDSHNYHLLFYAGHAGIDPRVDLTTTYHHPKLEAGNVATDWSPAPEDVSSDTAKAQLTADQATLAINNYKTDADGRISRAQADIKVNANAISTKVEKSDYDKKTGDLTTSINKAQQTADSATQTIGTYKETNDKRVSATETNIKVNSDAIKLTASKTDLDKATGKLSGDISTLQQRADGFEATVTKVNNLAVGGRNYVLNSDVSTSSNITNFKTSIPVSGFSGKKIVISVQVDYDNITGFNNPSPFHRVMFEPTFIDKGTGRTIYANGTNISPKIGDSFHGRIYSVFDFSNTEIASVSSDANALGQGIYVQGLNSDTPIVVSRPKIEIGTQPTDGTPAPEDVNTQLAQVKITADGVYQTVNNPQTGLNTRVSTAEGNITKVQGAVSGMSNTVTQTANGLTQEIADRKTGDSNTLQAGKDFTTSQIKSYDTGIQSQITQVSDGIMASVSATNLIVDSSFVNAFTNWTLSGDVSWKIDTSTMYEGVRVATFNNGNVVFDRKTATMTSTPIYTMNLGGTHFYASFDLYAKSFGTSAYFKAEIVQKDSSGSTTKSTPIGGSFDTGMSGWNNYMADITLDSRTTSLYLQFTQYGGGVVSVSRPYLGSTKLPTGAYMPGASNDNSSILKLFNNFFAFGIQSNTGALISGINGDSSGLNIAGKKITVTGDTNFIGKNFMDGALIKNASIGTAQIADVSITNAKIASLDVNKISGNVSNFIQSNWNGRYESTQITADGMTVSTSNITTSFGYDGMNQRASGKSVGGIGIIGNTGMPSNYKGLSFNLDGTGDFMAFSARNNGTTSGTYPTKLAWFRGGNAQKPAGADTGWTFYDQVTFNNDINVQGKTNQKLGFSTQTFNGFNYPYFGDNRGQAGLAYGSGETYLLSGKNYYFLSRVIKALSGLGAVKIPQTINSNGTVAKWLNVTL